MARHRSLRTSSLRGVPTRRLAATAVFLSLLATAVSGTPFPSRGALPSAQEKLAELAAKMPLRFEENAGQVREAGVRYFARGNGYRLFLGSRETLFRLGPSSSTGTIVRLHLAGGAEHPLLAGIDPLARGEVRQISPAARRRPGSCLRHKS